jgi:hypothetical protein
MTQVNRLNSRIVKLERERDQLVRTNLKLRDLLLKQAKECTSCDGAGVVTVIDSDTDRERQEPCGDCYPIREVLGQ